MLANGENGAPVAAPPAPKPRATKETKDKNPPTATGPVPSASSAADVAAATNELKKQADQMRVAKEQAEIKVRASTAASMPTANGFAKIGFETDETDMCM
jgi:mevalonate pyrophosphate decarboxylase